MLLDTTAYSWWAPVRRLSASQVLFATGALYPIRGFWASIIGPHLLATLEGSAHRPKVNSPMAISSAIAIAFLIGAAALVAGCNGETAATLGTDAAGGRLASQVVVATGGSASNSQSSGGATGGGGTAAAGSSASPYVWSPVKIIDGGDMPSLVMHPSVQGLMYIRANIGGAYRFDASKQIWVPITDWISGPDSNLSGVESIAVDPSDADRVYLVAGMYLPSYNPHAAILRSTDNGNTFQRIDLPFTMGGNDQGQQTGERLVVNPFKPSQLYLATHLNGLWQSTDYGSTWSQLASFPITASTDSVGLSFVRFDPKREGAAYVGAFTGGMYRTLDGGASWQSIPGQLTTLSNGETARPKRSALDPGSLYVSYANRAQLEQISAGAVYKLDLATDVWTNITPVDPGGFSGYGYCGIAVDPQRPGTVMVATWDRWYPGDTIFRSTNGGTSWTSLTDYSVRDGSLSPYVYYGGSVAPFGNWISSIEIDPFDSARALYTTGATVWATQDLTNADTAGTVHWTVGADGIEETAGLSLASPTSGAHLVSGLGDVGGYRHDDFSASPPPFLNPWMQSIHSVDVAANDPLHIVRVGLLDYANHAAGAYSRDQGTTWTPFASNAPGVDSTQGVMSLIAISPDGNNLVWAPFAPWWQAEAAAPQKPCAGAPLNLWVASDGVNSNKFYGFHGSAGTFYTSIDGGASFGATAAKLPIDKGNNNTAQAHPEPVPEREGDVWLATSGGLFHSTDSGSAFNRVASMDRAEVIGFGKAAMSSSYPVIYAVGVVAGIYGIFRSDDEAISWYRINDDRHQFGVLSVVTGDPRIYGRIYLGTSGRGILYGDPGP